MNFIKLTGNNGSVPDPYFKSFQLVFFQNGVAQLEIISGRENHSKVTESVTKHIDSDEIQKLIEKGQQLKLTTEKNHMVGGPQKTIEIQQGDQKKTLLIGEEDPDSQKFYKHCLQIFNSNLQQRLESVFNS